MHPHPQQQQRLAPARVLLLVSYLPSLLLLRQYQHSAHS
jgi:hypothetical protein